MSRRASAGRFAAAALATALVVLAGGGSALGGPGDLDPGFGFTGRVTTALGAGAVANALVIQPDGKIVATGASNNGSQNVFALARYNPDGSLDPSFNGTGKVTTQIGAEDNGTALALQPDGKVVAGGTSNNGSQGVFALARYSPDGSLDPSFNGTGKVTTPILADDGALGVAVQPNGRIVAAGATSNGFREEVALARYNANGSLDTSFNGVGKVVTLIANAAGATGVALQPDGKIVVSAGGEFALARYNPNGSLDTTFNGTGVVETPLGNADGANAVALEPDGRIVAAGFTDNGFTEPMLAVARYDPDGSLDPTFDGDGTVTTALGTVDDEAEAIAVQSDGKIVVSGYSNDGAETVFALVRYNPDGSLDTSFGGTGKLTARIGSSDIATGVALQRDGKIVAAGASTIGGALRLALTRSCGGETSALSAPARTAPGTRLQVAGAGFAAREAVDLYLDTTDVVLATSDACGAVDASVTMPVAIPPGAHWLTAVGRRSGYALQASVLVTADWPMFRFGAAHTGANPLESTLSAAGAAGLHLLWRQPLGASTHAAPASVGGVVYAVGAAGRVYALDGVSGSRLWQGSAAPPNSDSAPAATAASVFVGSTDGHAYAFDTADGQQRWHSAVIGSISAPPTVADGAVYLGTTDTRKLYALDVTTGAKRPAWTVFTAGGPIKGAPAVADGAVYFGTGAPDNRVIAVDAATGALIWQVGPFAGADFVSSPAVDSGSVFIGGQDGKLYGFDAGTGASLWTPAVTGAAIVSSPAVARGIVYAGSGDGSLRAYDPDTGQQVWSRALGGPVTGSPAVANGIVAVTVPSIRKLAILDAATGARIRTVGTRTDPSSPIVVNGTVYVSTAAGLQAYGLAEAPARRPDPASLTPDGSLRPS